MNIEDMILVSVDDHVVEPPSMFDAHIPARYRDRAPRIVKGSDGGDLFGWPRAFTRLELSS